MKRFGFLMLGMVVSLVILSSGGSFASERMVLGEMFTNTSCPYCYNAELALDTIAINRPATLSVIRYHTWWPSSSDPYYVFNTTENNARINYYGISYVPDFQIDGIVDGGSGYQFWGIKIDNRDTLESPLIIDLDGTYDEGTRTGTIEAEVTATDNVPQTNLRLHFVLTESKIYWPAPNGLKWHNQTMRDMIPDASGEAITISQGQTIESSRTFTVDPVINDDNCQLVVFVQSNTNKEVIQSAKRDLFPKVKVILAPDDTLVARGERLGFTMTIENMTDSTQTFEAWTEVRLPDGSLYSDNPILGPRTVTLSPHQSRSRHIYHKIPNNALLGTYTYCGKAGYYPTFPYDRDCFRFTVTAREP